MEASLFGSIIYVFSFVFLFVSVMQIRKASKLLNGVSWLVISFISVLCYAAMVAGIINIVNIPVNLFSIGIIYLVTSVVLQAIIRKEKEKQKYMWDKFDFVWIVIFTIIIFSVTISYFTTQLNLMFYNSDAAVHFKNAMYVLRNERLENMYFAPLLTALTMEIFMPFVAEVNLYKIYILIDAGMFLLETMFFMVLVKDFLKTRTMKIVGVFVAIVYTLGYPMNSYLFSFFYWAIGVMLIGYMLLMLRYYENQEVERRVSITGMMLCCGALPVTYMLFGPIVYIASFIVLIIYCKREGKIINKKNFFLALKVFAVPTILAIYYCYFDYLKKIEYSALEIMNFGGGIYRELFINFVWTLPFVIYMLIRAWKKKQVDETIVFTLFIGIFTIVMCLLVYKGVISSYYYYKFYFPIWLFFFILTIQAINELWENSKEIIIAFGLVFCFLGIMCFGKIEERVINSQTGLTMTDRTSGLFDLYKYNVLLWRSRTLQYSDEYFEICNYVIEEIEDTDKEIPLLATIENYSHCYWYEGITGQNCEDFYGWSYSFEEIEEKINNGETDYFVVFKDSPIYSWHKDYFDMFDYVFENERGFIAIVN